MSYNVCHLFIRWGDTHLTKRTNDNDNGDEDEDYFVGCDIILKMWLLNITLLLIFFQAK